MSNMKDVSYVNVDTNLISDHHAIILVKKHQTPAVKRKMVTGRQYKNYEYTSSKNVLDLYNWDEFFALTDPNKLRSIMHNVIYTSMDTICPVKTYQVEDHKPDWLNSERKRNIRLKKQLLKRPEKQS